MRRRVDRRRQQAGGSGPRPIVPPGDTPPCDARPDDPSGADRALDARSAAARVGGGAADAGGERAGGVGGGVPAPGVAGVSGLHGPENFLPLAVAAVSESDRLRAGIR